MPVTVNQEVNYINLR